MFIVISHHYCKPGQIETARQRMDKNAATLMSAPGILYRYRMERQDRPNVISALTAWNEEADFQSDRQRRFGGNHDLGATPYEKIEQETYQVHALVKSSV